jgi:NADH:ubiquinone oxidoreductase subunit F (NADH-binding)/(2Fe-2S) ferredoxin/ferredoxin
MMKGATTKGLGDLKKQGMASLFPNRIKIMVGSASCGLAAGAGPVFEAIKTGVKQKKIKARIKKTGCIGLCHLEPLVDIIIPGKPRLTYGKVTTRSIPGILGALKQGKVPGRALARITKEDFFLEDTSKNYTDDTDDQTVARVPVYNDLPFYKKQSRIALRNCGFIDPEDILEYIAKGGYFTLARTLNKKSPRQVASEVERSGLRGRGGAGFSTGLKWKICRNARADEKYLICNADEGDPGAYMDRSILEGDPHSVIEGMLITAYAIGAAKGFIYVRDEYPLAIDRLGKALKQARKYGLLGENILQSDFSFDIIINRGAGAFVCGEETAMIKSIEGDCGEPHQRPPYPAESGLWGKPTVINNVETLSTVPAIMSKGAKWFSSLGTEKSKGTKVFSLVGKINRIGLVEVPMGTTLREIIYDIGGGIPGGKAFKAVQTGGPSGGCIPAELIDLAVDYEALERSGSIMGSGGLIVMDEKTCMVDIARYFLGFLENESCGKCTPCRVGIKRMREILDNISQAKANIEDLSLLESMAYSIKESALCGLGRTAPNPVLSTLRYFKDEYEAHILRRKCPAGVCKALISYSVDAELCTGCGACRKACPADAVKGDKKKPHKINIKKCIKCGACQEVCPSGAVLT